ncbi:MAG: uracil-DNA glycosylase [Gammaproteobacteria bacterium]|nr:uracil-DNA glycosylase [Gammaproteobacteria bacterium]
MAKYKSVEKKGQFRLLEHLETGWSMLLQAEFQQTYFEQLEAFLSFRTSAGAEIYPQTEHIFSALNLTPAEQVKVVLLGQDPYHGPGQAHGLAFSVLPGQRLPPSLVNIFKELKSDLGLNPPLSGCLEKWARQGVLLLNTVLTVEKGTAGAHRNKGWEWFTDCVIKTVSKHSRASVFLLWGSEAQKKSSLINRSRHHILQAPHPSPLSAYRGFLGCRHFSLCNEFLISQGRGPVDWCLD